MRITSYELRLHVSRITDYALPIHLSRLTLHGLLFTHYVSRITITFPSADSILDDVLDLGKLVGADYDLDPLKDELAKEFGTHTLGDLDKKEAIPFGNQ